MIRNVDRQGDLVVQKIVNYYGKFMGYQYGIPGQGMTRCSTLTEARKAIGKFPAVLVSDKARDKLTLKSA